MWDALAVIPVPVARHFGKHVEHVSLFAGRMVQRRRMSG